MSNSTDVLNELSSIYKKFAIKVHPDHGGDVNDMKNLNDAYASFKSIILKYTDNKKSSFVFPYPNYPFRVEDYAFVRSNGKERMGKIIDIKFLSNGKYEFTIEFSKNDVQKFQRDTLNCSEDENFYLYTARWSE